MERKEAHIWEIYKALLLIQTGELRALGRPIGWGDIDNRTEIMESIWRMAAEMAETHERGIVTMGE